MSTEIIRIYFKTPSYSRLNSRFLSFDLASRDNLN